MKAGKIEKLSTRYTTTYVKLAQIKKELENEFIGCLVWGTMRIKFINDIPVIFVEGKEKAIELAEFINFIKETRFISESSYDRLATIPMSWRK